MSQGLMRTEFQLEKMEKFWRRMVGDGCTTLVNVLNASELYA